MVRRNKCIHGVSEEDSHPCEECQAIARRAGYKVSSTVRYIFSSQEQVDEALRNERKRKNKRAAGRD